MHVLGIDMAKNGLGRKPWIPDLEKVEALAAQGLTNGQIALCLGVSETTLYEKKRQLTGFSEEHKKRQGYGYPAGIQCAI